MTRRQVRYSAWPAGLTGAIHLLAVVRGGLGLAQMVMVELLAQ